MSMFGALNRFISRLDADPQPQKTSQHSAYGFQVLRNINHEINLEPWFDFIIGINGRNIDSSNPSLFSTEVRNCAGSSVEIGVWSAKGQRIRSCWLPVPADSSSLGISLQWQPLSSTEDVWHILEVNPNSPADEAGLLPYGDYIIGSPEALMKGNSGLADLVEDFIGQPMRFYVFNHEYDVTRLVTITPSRSWGGAGALGCTLGYGALHRIPASLDEPPQAPGETLFETARLSTDIDGRPTSRQAPRDGASQSRSSLEKSHILIPTEVTSPPPGVNAPPSNSKPPQMTPASRRNKPARRYAGAVDMNDYFQEGEARSREADNATSSKMSTPPAPPPKAGETATTSLPPEAPPVPDEDGEGPGPAATGDTSEDHDQVDHDTET